MIEAGDIMEQRVTGLRIEILFVGQKRIMFRWVSSGEEGSLPVDIVTTFWEKVV